MRVRRVVTTRAGGASRAPFHRFNLSAGVGDDPGAVAANRRRLAAGIGLPPDSVHWMRQVHGTRTAVVTATGTVPDLATPDRDTPDRDTVPGAGGPAPLRAAPGRPEPEVDALVTDRPGTALAVLSADCVPILLADRDAGVLGAVHAGRVGAADGVLPAALAAMTRLGARADRVEALLGPAVCGACYEVPAGMRATVEAALPGSACSTATGTPGLDLRAGLRTQLRAAGVTRIDTDPRCTVEDPDLYSHRRDGRTGRLATLTWLDPG